MTSFYEETNHSKAIMRVGLPAMLGQLTTLIYNIADTFFVSLTKEPAAIAGVLTLVLGFVFLPPLAKLANGFVHLFRSVGLIKEGTVGLVLGNVVNMGLDYVFIAILGW